MNEISGEVQMASAQGEKDGSHNSKATHTEGNAKKGRAKETPGPKSPSEKSFNGLAETR